MNRRTIMTAPAETAGNGTKPAPERVSGMARIRDAQSYHLSSLAHDAAFEAERLCSQIYRTASDGYSSYLHEPTSAEAKNVADDPAIHDKAREALACLATAITYLNYLFDVLPDA
jgi:hypothetical protein